MLSLEECKKKLHNNEKKYTDEEVQAIREFLYKLGYLNIEYIKSKIKKNDKGHFIHESFNR
jgi:hypothetical protein